MEQHKTNCPSSNNWVKFEDSDHVTNLHSPYSSNKGAKKAAPSASDILILTPQCVFKPAQDQENNPKNIKNYSRYSVFDHLRFGANRKSELGWSRHLLEKPHNVEARSWNY